LKLGFCVVLSVVPSLLKSHFHALIPLEGVEASVNTAAVLSQTLGAVNAAVGPVIFTVRLVSGAQPFASVVVSFTRYVLWLVGKVCVGFELLTGGEPSPKSHVHDAMVLPETGVDSEVKLTGNPGQAMLELPDTPGPVKLLTGEGFTVIVNEVLPQVFDTVIVATCVVEVAGGIKAGISPVPLAGRPIAVLSLVQVFPCAKINGPIESLVPLHPVAFEIAGGGSMIIIPVDAGYIPHPSSVNAEFPEIILMIIGTPTGIPIKS
jgi:hypothetical protein